MIDRPITMYGLQVERHGAGSGADMLVKLTQEDPTGNQDDVIILHPLQVRLLAERVGILPMRDETAWRAIVRLSRQLRILLERIGQQFDEMVAISAGGHASVDGELAYARATYDLAHEFVADLPVVAESLAPNPPDFGVVAEPNPPKSGAVARSNPQSRGRWRVDRCRPGFAFRRRTRLKPRAHGYEDRSDVGGRKDV